jgi:hypothetical protein
MAINKNHLFEDIEGVKCAVVETGVSEERVEFLKSLLEFNRYTVIVAVETDKKAPAPVVTTDASAEAQPITDPTPTAKATYKIGVTDVTFNVTNAMYGRLLRTPDKRVVTMAYWLQKENVSRDDVPYFDRQH